MTHVFHRHLRKAYPQAVRGEGVYIVDDQGKRYLDASGGAGITGNAPDYFAAVGFSFRM